MVEKIDVLDFLRKHTGEILSVGYVASSLRCDASMAESYLQKLAQEGEVRRTGRGYTCMERISEEAHAKGNNKGTEEEHAS